MKTTIIISYLMFISLQAKADDQFVKLYKWAEDTRDIVTKPMAAFPFELNTVQSDQVDYLSKLDNLINVKLEAESDSVNCDKKTSKELLDLKERVKKRDYKLDAVFLSSGTKFEQNALGRFMNDDFISHMVSLYNKGNTKVYDVYSVEALTQTYKLANPDKNFDSLNISEKESVLNAFAESYIGEKLPPGLLMKEMAYQQMVNHSSDWKKTLLDSRDKLSSEQKIQLVSKLGGFFGNNYNYARASNGIKEHGIIVTPQQLLDSVKNGNPGGVCRDVALAQVQFLDALGFKNNYVIAFKTMDNYHANVISVDPVTHKIIKFNYDETTSLKAGAGVEALTQDTSMPDHGVNFRIYDSNGKPVTKVSSELSEMLKSSAGGESSRTFNSKNYNINKVGFSNGSVSGSIFTGKTSLGESLTGVSVFTEQASDYSKSSMGVSVSKLSGDRSLMHMDQTNFYLRASTELNSPSISLGPVKSSAFIGVDAEVLVSKNSETYLASNYKKSAEKLQVDGNIDMYLGVQNKLTSSDQKTSIDNKIYANFYPDVNNVAKIDRLVLALDSVVVRTDVSHQISDTTKALIDTAVVMRNYGTNIVIKAILEDQKNGAKYSVGGSVPVTKDMPSFLPGAERRATASAEVETKSGIILLIEYGRKIDTKTNEFAVKAQGKF